MQIAAKPGYDPDTLTLESSVSIWMDGEGNALCPDGLDSSVGRQVWDTYHLGSTLFTIRKIDYNVRKNPIAIFSREALLHFIFPTFF